METPPDTSQSPPKRRGFPIVVVGGLAALAAGLGAAWVLVGQGSGRDGPPPASEGGLVIDATGPDDGQVEPGKLLRCFVQGQYVGELSLTACAQRNGVATDALDVGLDATTGALTAAQTQAELNLIPLPPAEDSAASEEAAPAEEAEEVQPVSAPAACWRHGGGRWRKVASDGDLDACVQTLFAGRCEKPGGASYGRYGPLTLRLVAGRVEVADDNRSFRNLVAQAPDCSIPPVG